MDDALSYRDRLPLHWTPLAAFPAGVEADRMAESNARLLTVVEMLGDHPQPGDDPNPTELELQRIHQKLNLLLDLFGTFLSTQARRPPAVPVRLSWRSVAWAGDLPAGSTGLVELYLSPVLPQPLRLPATIAAGSAPGEACAEFAAMPEFCQTALERHVFQRHRREIAEKQKR
jgi:hypothetical protein